ncbi:MAG: 7-cyano-7-deazaguanine synthase QueC [Verrucomicrobia bacterium]|nr:7-cyano-7-deazaguanine synthase QueC [Verrucomicrobiota bacterium]
MSSRRKVVVLLSGGMDSVTALHDAVAHSEVLAALSFEYGARHHAKELPFAQWHARHLGVRHEVLPLGFVGAHFNSALLKGGAPIPRGHYEEDSMRQTVVPFRNGIMLAVAAGFAESAGASGLVIAAHSGDHAIYPDCREEFMGAMEAAIRLGTYEELSLLRPFIAMDKAAIVRRGAALRVDYARTWSCYVGGELHCGECGTCVERREAFLVAGVPDPTVYASLSPLPPKPVV